MSKKKQKDGHIFRPYEFLKEYRADLLKRYTTKWKETYLPFDLLNMESHYYLIISERSDGKSFIIGGEMILYLYINYGFSAMLLRRFELDIRGSNGEQLISNLIGFNEKTYRRTKGKYNNAVEEISNHKWNTIIYKSRKYYLARKYENEDGKELIEIDSNPFMHAWAISQQVHNRGGGMEKIKIIVFDEYISREGYLENEFIDFQDTLKTIIRRRNDVLVFMCGNAIDRYSIYHSEMNLRGVKNQKAGTIENYIFDTGLKISVEVVDYVAKEYKISNVYFSFDNPKLQADLMNKWEIGNYQHLPEKYKPNQVIYRYYIIYDNEKFECEIIETENNTFTFIHPKTTDIKINDDTIIFDLNAPISWHYRKRITNVYDDIGKLIASYYKQEKICYSNNEVGHTIFSYLRDCK